MKLTQILNKQHIGRHFKLYWARQSKLKIQQTTVEKILKEKNVQIYRPEELLQEKRLLPKYDVVGYKAKPIQFDETHPNWKDRTLLTYKDNNVLLEGLAQAKLLTNTVELVSGLPERIEVKNLFKEIDEQAKKITLASHVFDAEQKKLPKIKDPERPAWNFPRTYGITQDRVNKLLVSRLIQLIESRSDLNSVRQHSLIDDLIFSYPFEKNGDLIQFQLKGDILLSSKSPLNRISEKTGEIVQLPDIFPIKPTITLNEEHIYKIENIYPINRTYSKLHPHTVFIFYNKENVKNVFEEEVTEQQIFGRTLLKTFTVAASYAKFIFGNDEVRLPKPVVVQAVQTDGKFFHFGVLQLNTLNTDDVMKNLWYQTDLVPLFDICSYQNGKPTLSGYNGEVMKYLNSFYNNV